jgi:hypothetical protein
MVPKSCCLHASNVSRASIHPPSSPPARPQFPPSLRLILSLILELDSDRLQVRIAASVPRLTASCWRFAGKLTRATGIILPFDEDSNLTGSARPHLPQPPKDQLACILNRHRLSNKKSSRISSYHLPNDSPPPSSPPASSIANTKESRPTDLHHHSLVDANIAAHSRNACKLPIAAVAAPPQP